MAIMTAASLREAMPELTGTAEDTKLETLISRADAWAARWCGIPPASATAAPTLESTTYTLYLTGSGGRELYLPLRNFTSITSIYDDPTLDFTSSTYLVSSGDYALRYDPLRGQFVMLTSTATHGAWSETPRAIRVVGAAGYATVPGHVQEAIRKGLRNMWEERKRAGKLSISNQGSTSYMEGDERHFLCPETRELLAMERLPHAVVGGGWA